MYLLSKANYTVTTLIWNNWLNDDSPFKSFLQTQTVGKIKHYCEVIYIHLKFVMTDSMTEAVQRVKVIGNLLGDGFFYDFKQG